MLSIKNLNKYKSKTPEIYGENWFSKNISKENIHYILELDKKNIKKLNKVSDKIPDALKYNNNYKIFKCLLNNKATKFINYLDIFDHHIGFYAKDKDILLKLIKKGGKKFVNQISCYDNSHMGFRIFDRDVLLKLIKIGGKKFVTHLNDKKQHIGFNKVDKDILLKLIEIGGEEFVNQIDYKNRHMGFYTTDQTVLSKLIEIGGKKFVDHLDNK